MSVTTTVKPMTQIQKKYLKDRVDNIVQYAENKMNRIEVNDSREVKRSRLKEAYLKQGYDTTRLISYVNSVLNESFNPYDVFGYHENTARNANIEIPIRRIFGSSESLWDDVVKKIWNDIDDINDTKRAIKNNIVHKGNFLQDDIILSFHSSYDKVCDKVKAFQDWTDEQVKDYEEQVNEFNNKYKETI